MQDFCGKACGCMLARLCVCVCVCVCVRARTHAHMSVVTFVYVYMCLFVGGCACLHGCMVVCLSTNSLLACPP